MFLSLSSRSHSNEGRFKKCLEWNFSFVKHSTSNLSHKYAHPIQEISQSLKLFWVFFSFFFSLLQFETGWGRTYCGNLFDFFVLFNTPGADFEMKPKPCLAFEFNNKEKVILLRITAISPQDEIS